MALFLTYVDIALVFLGLYLLKKWLARPAAPLPPGPRPYPLIENLLDMPTSQEWLTFAKWGQTWGTSPFASPSILAPVLSILLH